MPAPRRVVLGPNVLVSAAITPSGSTAAVTDLIDAGIMVPVVSRKLLGELDGVLRREKFRQYPVPAGGRDLVGFITVGPMDGDADADTGEVYALNVAPDAWGNGYGQALLSEGVRALRDVGFNQAVLWVHPNNERARHSYERAGWEHDGQHRVQKVLGVTVPEVCYRRHLQLAS